jgi:dTDP-4-amino-4,6-dideoxygalactose transaminase
MLKALGKRIESVKFYEVGYDLTLPSLNWLDRIQPNDLVILVDYFGLPCDRNFINRAKEQGAWVLEDACQALLTEGVGRYSDFVLFSPRKYLGVPDGGILVLNRKIPSGTRKVRQVPVKWWLKTISATILRREFDLGIGSRRWFELFQETEADGPIGLYAMSGFSRILLENSFDYPSIAQKRVRNYRILNEKLMGFALFPSLPPHVVPLGFPIRVEGRDQVRQALFAEEIYPPVHWPIKGIVPKKFRNSHRLSDEIMTLPCDQRYGPEDMERIARVFLQSSR